MKFPNPTPAAYFGLIPCQDASAETNRLGHITRQGPGTARKYLVEAAWQKISMEEPIGSQYDPGISKGKTKA